MLVNGISTSFNQLTLMILCFCPHLFSDWTAKTYPDLRSEAFECGDHLPRHSFLCDPDHLLTREDGAFVLASFSLQEEYFLAESVNQRLYELAVSTPCQCQRRSQCIAVGPDGNQFYVGFVTTVALVRKLKTSSMDPADNQALVVAEKFARALRNRWALGDCDNSALILIWESQSILHIATDRVTKLYVTKKEIHQIQTHLADLIWRKAYLRALELILDILRNEYSGMPEEHVDTGTLSLIVSIAVAGILGLIITGCVCAFRCCGNLRPDPVTSLSTAVRAASTSSIKKNSQRRESIFRQPLSRSPCSSDNRGQRYSPVPSLITASGYDGKTYGQIDYSVV